MPAPLARVTGTGATCHAGSTVSELWSGMQAAQPQVSEVADPHLDAPVRLMYRAPGHQDAVEGTAAGDGPTQGRAHALARRAGREALTQAGGVVSPARQGLVVGSCMGNSTESEAARAAGVAPPPDWELFGIAAALAGDLGAEGPVLNVANACAAGSYAVGLACDLLRTGECDRVVVVGVEAYSRVALACFNQMGALDPRACRPFSASRAGTVFGEGAGALVLEACGQDGPRPGEVVLAGAEFSCDAGHPTAPDSDGIQAARTLRAALEHAGLTPQDVGLVVPHGTGTQLNDAVESQLLAQVWSAEQMPAAYSAKALIGHTGGGAGALAAVVAVECLRRGEVPVNCAIVDPMSGMAGALGTSTRPLRGAAVVNAYAFGGNNATLTFRLAA